MTSDLYLPALRPFSWLFNKYYGDDVQVLVAGFAPPSSPLPHNFSFLSLGDQADYPFNKWSNGLIKLLNTIDDEVFILFLDDYWLTRPVNRQAVQILVDYAIQFRYVLKIDLCTERLYAFGSDLEYGHVAWIDLVKSMPGSPYHMSLWLGIWRRDNLLRCLVPDESPHDLEMGGSTMGSHIQDLIVLGTRQNPARISLGLRGGDHSQVNLEGLAQQDVEEMEQKGYFEVYK